MAEDEVGLPRATINKMVRDALPSDARLSADCCEKIIDCCTEFVNLISSEANEVCNKESKTTIHPDHVIKALTELQYTEFLPEVQEVWDKYKSEHKWGDKKLSKQSGADKVLITHLAIVIPSASFFGSCAAIVAMFVTVC